MEQPASTVVQPTRMFRIQLSPDTAAEASYSTLTKAGTGYASPSSYALQEFFDGEPLLRETTSLNLDRLAPADTKQLSPISFGRYGDPFAARALSEAVFKELGDSFRSFQDQNDGYVRVQLQIDGPDGDIHDLPWEYLTLPWRSDQPLATDERTPFARLIGRRPRSFRPSDEQVLRVLVVFESALAEDPSASGLDSSEVRYVVDALSALSDFTGLQVTLLTGAAYGMGIKSSATSAGDTIALPSDRFQLVDASLRSYAKGNEIGQFHILQFVPASQSTSTTSWYDTRATQQAANLPAPPSIDRYASLGWVLDNAKRLPPLMVLPSVFVSQSQTRRLTRFVDQGAVAVLEMPDFDAETTWLGLQVFYERLLEHGIADIALNQLRRSWIDNTRFPPQLPILWTAAEDGRLFARPVEFAETSAQGKLTSPGLEQEVAAPVQLNASLAKQPSRKGARPNAAKLTQQGTQPNLEAKQPGQSVPALPDEGPSRQEAAKTEKPTTSEDTVQTKGTAKRQPSTKAAKLPQPVDKPRTARRRPSEDQAAGNSSTLAARAAGAGQAGGSQSAGPALGGNGGGAPPPIVFVDLSRYDPPEPDNVVSISRWHEHGHPPL